VIEIKLLSTLALSIKKLDGLSKVPSFSSKYSNDALNILNNMIKSLKDEDALKTYLSSIIYKIELTTKAKYIPISENYVFYSITKGTPTFSSSLVTTDEARLSLEQLKPMSNTEKGGVYLITHLKTQKVYIGSAINFVARFKQHKTNSLKQHRGGNSKFYSFVKDNGGWSEFI
jgi:hypothetical protein